MCEECCTFTLCMVGLQDIKFPDETGMMYRHGDRTDASESELPVAY